MKWRERVKQRDEKNAARWQKIMDHDLIEEKASATVEIKQLRLLITMIIENSWAGIGSGKIQLKSARAVNPFLPTIDRLIRLDLLLM